MKQPTHFRFIRSSSLIIALALGMSALTPGVPAAQTLFDVNDLNFLFPLDASGMPYPDIKMTDRNGVTPETPSGLGQVWPKHLFDDIIARAKGADGTVSPPGTSIQFSASESNMANWRVVGARFIPCVLSRKTITGELFSGFPGCVTQVRLVAQPFDQGKARDVSVHLVYSIGVVPVTTFDEFVKAVNPQITDPSQATTMQKASGVLAKMKAASAALGADTNGQPMQPHPGLVKELSLPANQRRLGPAVKQFVQGFTQPRAMTNISFMGLGIKGFEPWIFFGGELGPDPKTRPEAFAESDLAFAPKGGRPTNAGLPQESSPAIMLSFVDPPQLVHPAPNDMSTSNLFGSNPSAFDKSAVFTLDNPGIKHNFNVDCVSCHTTTTRANNIGIRTAAGDNRLPSPPGITGYIHSDSVPRSDWNVRNFGHFIHPLPSRARRTQTETITTRTLAEIIDSTHLMNDIMRRKDTSADASAADPAGPGLICTDEAAVWNCTIVDGGSDCFKDCQVAPPPAPPIAVKPSPGDGGAEVTQFSLENETGQAISASNATGSASTTSRGGSSATSSRSRGPTSH